MPIHILTQFIHVQGQAHTKNLSFIWTAIGHIAMWVSISAVKWYCEGMEREKDVSGLYLRYIFKYM